MARDVATANSLRSALQATKSHPHDIVQLEFSGLASVRRAAANINAKVSAGDIPRIQALVFNAGYREPFGQTRTKNDLDAAFATNHLVHWLLVMLSLQSMNKESGRVVVTQRTNLSALHVPLDKPKKASEAYEEARWKKVCVDASSETIDSVAKSKWSGSPEDPSKDTKQLSGIRRYGASKLCSIIMM
ncbi:putative Ketoreductase (KR) domain-containing protein [Seiridium unicorne]|uniref:Ketoreductase (KR) domain-containing protein n=1 Tax=Seiridium unicorne TaxID=138068 RepID=A0ABR2UYZ0_9PEZI